MHATEFLADPHAHSIGPAAAIFGAEAFLRQSCRAALRSLVLADDQEETVFPGRTASLSDVLDELKMVSMWGDHRMVVLEDADEFVSEHRSALEKYLAKPAKKSVLVFDVKTWNKSTKLAKAVQKIGLTLSCEKLEGRDLQRWIAETAKRRHGKQIARDAGALLVELIGDKLGLIEQELDKLASYVGTRASIETDDVRQLVGGWRIETTWKMLDSLRDGGLAKALEYLDNLLENGEHPLKLLGGLNYVFRKFSEATELARQGVPLEAALKQAKVFPQAVRPTAAYLKRIGFGQAEQIRERIVRADGDLKGRSRISERVRMEQLLVELSGRIPAVPRI